MSPVWFLYETESNGKAGNTVSTVATSTSSCRHGRAGGHHSEPMRRVFLDTNILLDFALEREHAEEAEKILALGLAGAIDCSR